MCIKKSADPGRRAQLLFLCSIQNFVTRCPSKIPSPKSKIQDPQNPKSKIQNPQNPKSKIPKLQNPSFFGRILGIWGILDFRFWGFWILDFGFGIPAPKSKIQTPQNPKSKIQNPQNPTSKIPKIQNPKSPKSKIQNPQNPKSKTSAKIQNLGRWGPHVKNCYITTQNPKSKIPKIRPKKFGFWILGILGILDFGFWGFWILDFRILGILDFGFWGFWGFWILGILVILDFGFWDFGDFGFWGFWGFWILDFGILGILGILDFGFWGFWGFWILDFGILGRSRGCTTRQFGDGAWRSEARIPPGLPLGATSKPTVSNRVGARKQIEHFFRGQNPTKSQKNPDFQPRGQNFTKSQKNPGFQPRGNFIAMNFLAQINVDYPGRRPQAPACFKYLY